MAAKRAQAHPILAPIGVADHAPDARIVRVKGPIVIVSCPYCGDEHTHMRRSLDAGKPVRLAPGCGLTQPNSRRLNGYKITLKR